MWFCGCSVFNNALYEVLLFLLEQKCLIWHKFVVVILTDLLGRKASAFFFVIQRNTALLCFWEKKYLFCLLLWTCSKDNPFYPFFLLKKRCLNSEVASTKGLGMDLLVYVGPFHKQMLTLEHIGRVIYSDMLNFFFCSWCICCQVSVVKYQPYLLKQSI